MRDLSFYLDKAIERSSVKSDRKLSVMLGLGPTSVSFYRRKNVLPNDEVMIRLARIAGIDPAIALMDLNMWRSPDEAKKTYASILQKITAAMLLLAVSCGFSSPTLASTSQQSTEILYIMENNMHYI